ncbi:MAG: epoxyqueuosine reductase [Deltaproteobacteria bacterium]|nr:epoxyqueuosine reductase [Deltaproteobacteria bacterium]
MTNHSLSIENLRKIAERYVAEEPGRLGAAGFWKSPLLVTASIDERFSSLRQIAAKNHLHPHELLASARSVIVFFIPFKEELVRENQIGDRPCRNWGLAYVQTNDLIGRLARKLSDFLAASGRKSELTPATHNFDEKTLTARWSHKHLAYLAGLGRFGTHHMLITPAGCAGRLGSLVTEAELGAQPIIETDEACLLKAGEQCGQCITACPVNAISDSGFDRKRCWDRLNDNYQTLTCYSDLPETTHVCGKCVAMMPCSFENPVAKS